MNPLKSIIALICGIFLLMMSNAAFVTPAPKGPDPTLMSMILAVPAMFTLFFAVRGIMRASAGKVAIPMRTIGILARTDANIRPEGSREIGRVVIDDEDPQRRNSGYVSVYRAPDGSLWAFREPLHAGPRRAA